VRPCEIWAKTKGGLAAPGSRVISHRGSPPACVIAMVQPDGKVPSVPSSKRIVSAEAIEQPINAISKYARALIAHPIVHRHSDDWVKMPYRRSSEFSFNTSLDGGMQILIVEDDQRLARELKQVLDEHGHSISLAFDGLHGLEAAQQGLLMYWP
jgi:hypothetical protein